MSTSLLHQYWCCSSGHGSVQLQWPTAKNWLLNNFVLSHTHRLRNFCEATLLAVEICTHSSRRWTIVNFLVVWTPVALISLAATSLLFFAKSATSNWEKKYITATAGIVNSHHRSHCNWAEPPAYTLAVKETQCVDSSLGVNWDLASIWDPTSINE